MRTLLGTKLLLTLHPTTKIYLRDVDDHLTAMLQRLDVCLLLVETLLPSDIVQMSTEMLNNTNATNLAMISLLMTDSANEVNEVSSSGAYGGPMTTADQCNR